MSRTSCLVAPLSDRCTEATASRALFAPAGCGRATADTSGRRLIRAAAALTWGELAGAAAATPHGGGPLRGEARAGGWLARAGVGAGRGGLSECVRRLTA